jgi:hypothetical protein
MNNTEKFTLLYERRQIQYKKCVRKKTFSLQFCMETPEGNEFAG